jgi:hypothetical protein
MKPRDRSFNDPSKPTQAAPVECSTTCDIGTDPPPPQSAAVRLRVISSVSIHRYRAMAWMTLFATNHRNRVHQRLQFIDVRGVGPGQNRRQRDATAVNDQMVFAPRFGSIRRVWAGLLTSAQRSHRGAINYCSRPVDSIRGLEFRQQQLVQTLPNSSRLPIAQPSPARHAAPPPQFRWQVLPANTRPEYEQDAGQHLAVVQRLSTRKAEPPRLRRWEEWFDSVPEFLWQYPS